MNKVLLKNIVKHINEGSCIVILGPQLLSSNGLSINAQLNKRLAENLEDMVKCYDEDGFVSYEIENEEYVETEVKEFFDELNPNDLYQKIAEIPFSMVINTAPDLTLKNVMEDKGIDHVYGYYHKGKTINPPVKTAARYVYNIFGDYTHFDSMILTYSDLYEYLQSIMENIGQEIKKVLHESKTVLFFGFSFDKWYFQLLLWLMKVKGKVSHDIGQENIKDFFNTEFKVKFFKDNDAAEIIEELYKTKSEGHISEPELKEFYAEMYISYAWGGESEEMAIELEKSLQDNKIRLVRDKKDLGYKERIKEFMDRIGKAQGVVLVISDKYLRSKYCMYELTEIYDNADFDERIFPVILQSSFFQPDEQLKYKEYWKSETQQLEEKIKNPDAAETLGEQYKNCKRIYENFDKVAGILADMNVLDPEIHLSTNFEALINEIKTNLNIVQ